MEISGINQSDCIQCEKCLHDCPSKLFTTQIVDGKKIVEYSDPLNGCILCGHCVAICPTSAIQCSSIDPILKITSDSTQIPTFNQIKLLLRKKRSIRQFSNERVSKEDLEAVLDVMRYSPSASNARKWEFLVITDPKRIKKLSIEVVKTIKLTRSLVRNPVIRNFFIFGETRKQVKQPSFMSSLNYIIKTSKQGGDPIFFDAPCLIILHSPKYGNLASCDSGISLTYGMLAAETKGLGSCWIGAAQEAMQRWPQMRKKFGLKRNQIPWGCFILGKPAINYKQLPPRDPVKVDWQ